MKGVFSELLISLEDIVFIKDPFVREAWANKDKLFTITKSDIGWNLALSKTVEEQVQSFTFVHYKTFPTLKSAKQCGLEELKESLSSEEWENLAKSIHKIGSTAYNIRPKNNIFDFKYTGVKEDGVYCTGSSVQGWDIDFVTKMLIQQTNCAKTTDIFTSRKSLTQYILNILSENLYTFYEENLYLQTKEKKVIEDKKQWWIPFVRPEIDLTSVL